MVENWQEEVVLGQGNIVATSFSENLGKELQ